MRKVTVLFSRKFTVIFRQLTRDKLTYDHLCVSGDFEWLESELQLNLNGRLYTKIIMKKRQLSSRINNFVSNCKVRS